MRKKSQMQATTSAHPRRQKINTEPNQAVSNKENFAFKSDYENESEATKRNCAKVGPHQQAVSQGGCTVTSPTFQTVSLKDGQFRKDLSIDNDYHVERAEGTNYVTVGFSLKNLEKEKCFMEERLKEGGIKRFEERIKALQERIKVQQQHIKGQEEQLRKEKEDVKQLRRGLDPSVCRLRLEEHYKAKSYWKKLEALLRSEEQDISILLELEEMTTQNRQLKKRLIGLEQTMLNCGSELPNINAQQLQREKKMNGTKEHNNDTVVFVSRRDLEVQTTDDQMMSAKKCRKCDLLQLKQQQCNQLMNKSKEISKALETAIEAKTNAERKGADAEEKYNALFILHEEVQRKRKEGAKQLEKIKGKQKDLEDAVAQLKRQLLTDSAMHSEFEQVKEINQAQERKISKMDEKHRRQVQELREQVSSAVSEKQLYSKQVEKLRTEIDDVKAKNVHFTFQQASWVSNLKVKETELEEMSKKYDQVIKSQQAMKVALDERSQELDKIYELLNEAENLKLEKELQLNQERKRMAEREQQFRKVQEALKEAQGRLKGLEETENRIKECGYSSVQKQKERNGGGTATQSSQSNGNMAGNTYLIRKLVGKVRESCQLLRDAEEEAEGSQRRKGRENEQFQENSWSISGLDKFVSEQLHEVNNLVNRYKFLQKDSEILNDKLSYLSEYRDQDKALYRKELKLKEEALKSLIAFVPDTCREVVADFLLLIENLSKEEELDEEDVLRHQELRLSLEYEAQEWKDSIQSLQRKMRKSEEELQELRKRHSQKDNGRKWACDGRTREGVHKKDIRRKVQADRLGVRNPSKCCRTGKLLVKCETSVFKG